MVLLRSNRLPFTSFSTQQGLNTTSFGHFTPRMVGFVKYTLQGSQVLFAVLKKKKNSFKGHIFPSTTMERTPKVENALNLQN